MYIIYNGNCELSTKTEKREENIFIFVDIIQIVLYNITITKQQLLRIM